MSVKVSWILFVAICVASFLTASSHVMGSPPTADLVSEGKLTVDCPACKVSVQSAGASSAVSWTPFWRKPTPTDGKPATSSPALTKSGHFYARERFHLFKQRPHPVVPKPPVPPAS